MKQQPKPWSFIKPQDYVKAFDEYARTHIRGYSQRNFARKAKISSPNFLSLIISGKRSLQGRWLDGFIAAAKLDSVESDYLRLMSALEHCSSTKEREELLSRILGLIEAHAIKSLSLDQLQLLKTPLAWTLLYMMSLRDQRKDPKWFKKRLRIPASIPEIRESLNLLERLDLIRSSNHRAYEATGQQLQSSDQLEKAQNYEFHKHTLTEGLAMLEELDPTERAFGSLTIAVPDSKINEFKAEVSKFGKSLLIKYGNNDSVSGEILRLNLQLYPLTQTRNDQ